MKLSQFADRLHEIAKELQAIDREVEHISSVHEVLTAAVIDAAIDVTNAGYQPGQKVLNKLRENVKILLVARAVHKQEITPEDAGCLLDSTPQTSEAP